MRRHPRIETAGLLLAAVTVAALLAGHGWLSAAPPAQSRTLTGVEAQRYLFSQKKYADAETYGYYTIWRDLNQPEALMLLGRTLEILKKNGRAVEVYGLLLRVLEDPTIAPADILKYKPQAEARLKPLDKARQQQLAAFIAAAGHKKFESPQTVDDGWMLEARCDLFSPYELACYTLIGQRRSKVPPDWIHNKDGDLHRSGAKFVSEYDGRKGLLYTHAIKDKPHPEKFKPDGYHVENLKRLGHPPHLTVTNIGDCPLLRVGIKGDNHPFELRVLVDGQVIFSQLVTAKDWADLTIEMPKPGPTSQPGAPPTAPVTTPPAQPGATGSSPPPPAHQQAVLELVCPEDRPLSGNVWIDYADFFEN